MRLRIFSIITIITFFSTLQIHAQTKQEQEKAKLILDEVSKKMKGYTSLKVECTYNLENSAAKINETQEGTLLLKGNKFKLTLSGREVISDGSNVWIVMRKAEEVHKKSQADFNEELGFDPAKIFTVYEEGFKFQFLKETKEGAKTIAVIDLFPLDPGKKNYSRLRMNIDKEKSQIVSSKTFGKDGNTYTLTVKTFTPNAAATDVDFKVNEADFKKQGFEIVDFTE
jgi:outer membrane lipoprotein-sorting protein